MKTRQILACASLLLVLPLLLAAPSSLAVQANQARKFADPAFERLWNRTDALLANGAVKRSWYWGPQPNTGPLLEDYVEGPEGKHLVQYFDKSRMELNNPDADPNSPFFVTNGLLTKELVSGNMQTGNNKSIFRYPAEVPVAGDTTGNAGAVKYASLGYVIEQKAQEAVGTQVLQRLADDGYPNSATAQLFVKEAERFGVEYAYYEPATKHNIPTVFFDFLNAQGPVVENGQETTAQLSVPYFYVTGYPISEAFWTQVTIAGEDTPVMVQAYERRVLTYVPDAPEGFKVQMGNVGQHYYDWRYNGAGKPEVLLKPCQAGTPGRRFSPIYQNNEFVRVRLKCMREQEEATTVTRQFFERGLMVSVAARGASRVVSGTGTRTSAMAGLADIYVLLEDGRVLTFNDVDTSIIVEPPKEVPPGLFPPSPTFLKTWLEQDLQDELGWAVTDTLVAPPDLERGGVVAYFEGGLMIDTGVRGRRRIYMLYASSGRAELRTRVGQTSSVYHVDRWQSFPVGGEGRNSTDRAATGIEGASGMEVRQESTPGQTHLNRLGTEEDLEEVTMAPAALEALGFDANLEGLLSLEQIESYVAQHSEVLGRVVGAGAVVVLSESHIQHPVQAVLDTPVSSSCSCKHLDRINTVTAQEVTSFCAEYTTNFSLCLYHADAPEIGPLLS